MAQREDDAAPPEDTASRRARLKARRRARKVGPRPMGVSGKSVFLIKQAIERRARAARHAQERATKPGSRRARRDGTS